MTTSTRTTITTALLVLTAALSLALTSKAALTGDLTVDPAAPAYLSTSVVEWNSDGVNEGWGYSSTRIGNVAITGGTYSGEITKEANSAYIGNQNLSFNIDAYKLLDIRIQHLNTTAPDLADVSLKLMFISTNGTVYSEANSYIFDTAYVPEDEQFHTYRLDLSDEPLWTQTLTGLRIYPLRNDTNVGDTFKIDYIRLSQPVPEPASAVVLGLAALFVLRRRG